MANGSTFIVMEVGRHIIKLMNVTAGDFYGSIEIMFRVRLKVTLKGHFSFTRLQFPLRLAHAGSAHKYQGQTCFDPSRVLYDVRTPPFCHGQSYVGLSRAQKSCQIILLTLPEHGRRVPCLIYPRLANWSNAHSNHEKAHCEKESNSDSDTQSIQSMYESNDFDPEDDICSVPPPPHSDMHNSVFEDHSDTSDDAFDADSTTDSD